MGFLIILCGLVRFWGIFRKIFRESTDWGADAIAPLVISFNSNNAVSGAWQTSHVKNREPSKNAARMMKKFGAAIKSIATHNAWSPDTRGTALQFRDAAPYLLHVVSGRAVIDDYGIKQQDGSWRLASGAAIKDANGTVIAAPTKADILAQAHASGSEWRTETFGFNAFANLPVQNIGIDIVNGQVADYTVQVTDQDGHFYVWARNLDRALSLQAKQGTSLAFNLRNYEVDFVKLQQQVDSSDDSKYRIELLTPAQFSFALKLSSLAFQPQMLTENDNQILKEAA